MMEGRYHMEYRKLPKGEEQISVIGLGNSSMGASGEKETEASFLHFPQKPRILIHA